MKTTSKRSLVLLLVSALLAGFLPLSGTASVKAAGYSLNNPRADSEGVTTWDCIWFGNYWQEDTNGDGKADKKDEKTPIKWRVLSVDGNDVFLVADKNLDYQRYSDADTDITWETCTMRSWLNGYGAEKNKDEKDYKDNNFFNNAFSVNEQSAIRITNVTNSDNPKYGTEGGNDTADKVYLLSVDEVTNPEYGFASSYERNNARRAVNTAYTAGGGEFGGEFGGEYMSAAGTAGDWWLRSVGIDRGLASFVRGNGYVNIDGNYVIYDYTYAVRPALHLSLLSNSGWTYAGSVTSEGREIETAIPTPDIAVSPPPTGEPNNTTENTKPTEGPNIRNGLSKGTLLRDKKNKVSYRVLAQDRVQFYKVDNKETTKIVIPSTVSMDGVKFKVTDISDNAFSGCKKLKSVTIGKFVTTIGNKAFSKCASLKKITIPSAVTKIGKKAFYGCKKLKLITIKTKKLKSKSVATQAFKGIYKKAVIKVPKKQKKAYTKWLKKKGITKKMKIK